ncbi:MAG: hypothetical protein WD492_11985 [Alkalispirochaeta sp.]
MNKLGAGPAGATGSEPGGAGSEPGGATPIERGPADLSTVRIAYDTDERAHSYEPEALWFETEGIGGFWSPLYRQGWILSPPPRDAEVVRRVRDALIGAAGAAGSGELEWKCFSWDGDAPWYGDAALRDAGFAPGDEEAILVADARAIADGLGGVGSDDVRSRGLEAAAATVRAVTDISGDEAEEILNAADTVHNQVWGEGQLPSTIARGYWSGDAVCSIHVAYLGNEPVAYGRFQATPGSRFGGLWSGATIPAARGHGCYRALVVSRAGEALRRGLPWLMVDANPETSMPILVHNGFSEIGRTRPYMHSFNTG